MNLVGEPSAFVITQDPEKSSDEPERQMVDRALVEYSVEVEEARKSYEADSERAAKKLSATFDRSVGLALKRGTTKGVKIAKSLTELKDANDLSMDEGRQIGIPVGIGLVKLHDALNSQSWQQHWEGTSSYLIPVGSDRFRGFYIPSGRQYGIKGSPKK